MSFTTFTGTRRSIRLSNPSSEVSSMISEDSTISTPRRSGRIARMQKVDYSESESENVDNMVEDVQQFEHLVDSIVERKFSFSPENEIIAHYDADADDVLDFEENTERRYPVRKGTRISYSDFFDEDDEGHNDMVNDEDWTPYQHHSSRDAHGYGDVDEDDDVDVVCGRSGHSYNLRPIHRVDYSGMDSDVDNQISMHICAFSNDDTEENYTAACVRRSTSFANKILSYIY